MKVLARDLDDYGRRHGGTFRLFGSAARGELRPHSDVDVLLDFPRDAKDDAWDFAESKAFALGLKPDIHVRSSTGGKLLAEIEGKQDESKGQREARFAIDSAASAARHFTEAARVFDEGGLDRGTTRGHQNIMALLHMMQSGHSSLETALRRLLNGFGEDLPTGPEWHAMLIDHRAVATAGRGAILMSDVAASAHVTRGFRHIAMHGYDSTFDPDKAADAIAAGRYLAERLPTLIAAAADQLLP